MKRRLLSLLLVMAMLLSMVPFQALAEEPDETPALLEAAEGIAPDDETTEVTIPETTEETVPETTEETVPETTEETVPETTEETVPETSEETVPETTEETVPVVLEEVTPVLLEEDPVGASEDTITVVQPENGKMEVLMNGQRYELVAKIGDGADNEGIEWISQIDFLPVEKDAETNKWYLSFSAEYADDEVKDGDECIITVKDVREDVTEKAQPVEVTVTLKAMPMMILEGMDGDYDAEGSMPQKAIRAGDKFQLKARLTKDSAINEGIEWYLDVNEKYEGCPPITVAKDGTVTFNKAFKFDEEDSVGGAWHMVVARQVVEAGQEKTVADSPAVIATFPKVSGLVLLDGEEVVKSCTLNVGSSENNSVTVAAHATDFGPATAIKWSSSSSQVKVVDNEDGTATVTAVGKPGKYTVTAACADNSKVKTTLTVNVVKVPESFQVKYPSSTRKYYNEGCLLTAGQKLSLSTNLPEDTTGKVTWEIVGGEYITSDPCSLNTVAPEGASADGEDWSAIATIDRNKGVLTTYAGVTAENCEITVRATLTPSVDGVGTITADLPVLIQPPVESFWVNVSWGLEAAPAPDEESAEGAVNRKDNDPRYREIGNGPFELYAGGFQPQIPADGVKWSIKVSKNVADWKETEDNTIIVTPKAPGKLTYTATAKDGSGAKYSGIVEIYGYHRDVEITSAPTTMTAGDKPVAIAAKAYYDDYQDFPIAKPTIWWDLMEAVEVDEDQATDPWGELIDGYFCYEEQYYRGEYTDAATIKGGKLTLGRITKNTKLLLVANCPGRSVYDSDSENWISSDVKDYVFIDVKPANEKALVLAYDYGDYYYPIETDWYHWNVLGGDERIRPVWMDNDGNVLEDLPTDFTYKVSGSACSYDKATGTLTFKKIGTSKLTVSCGGQSVTGEFRCVIPNNTITINGKDENNVITVVGGKSLSLKATGWYDSKTKATTQKFGWSIDDEAFDDKYYEDVYDYCWINWSTGKLTTYPVEEDYYVTVTAECYGEWMSGLLGEENCPSDTVTIHIIPEKTQYRSYAYVNGYNGYFYLTGEDQTLQPGDDFEYWVESYGRYVPSSGTDVISSNPKIAQVVKDAEGNVTGIKIPKDAKPGKVTITVKGQVLDGAEWVDEFWDEHGALIDGHWEGGEWIDAPSAKFTLNVVKPVTDIKLSRPTNKDGSFVPAYVGKSLKLTAKVNSDATNKKLNWGVCYYNGDPEGEFDWELDGDKLEELNWNDNTTVKNGVLKIDKSWYTHGRCYAVFASSQDGNYMSDPIFIQAYGMTGAINIASVGYWPDGERGEYVEYLNNRTVTIKQGEPLEFGAMVSDVTGEYYANPDVTWTISGKKNIVEKRYDGMHEEEEIDVLRLKGLNPGTVTIKATAKDGSRKTATFKLVVSNETYEN